MKYSEYRGEQQGKGDRAGVQATGAMPLQGRSRGRSRGRGGARRGGGKEVCPEQHHQPPLRTPQKCKISGLLLTY